MHIDGKCHCGNISFELEWGADPRQIPARACGCSFCVKHGGVWTSSPESALTVKIADVSLVSAYTFGSRTATFHVCTRCGVVPLVTSEIDHRLYAVINVNALEEIEPSRIATAAVTFEDENVESRLARRKRNWIGNVHFTGDR